MAKMHLTQQRVDRLEPRKAILDVRDTELKGFGIRIIDKGRLPLQPPVSQRTAGDAVQPAELGLGADGAVIFLTKLAPPRRGTRSTNNIAV